MACSTLLMISQPKPLASFASSGRAVLRLPPSRRSAGECSTWPSPTTAAVVVSSAASSSSHRDAILPKQRRTTPAASGFADQLKAAALRLHTREQIPVGEKEATDGALPPGDWTPSVEGYLRFLVDSKLVYDTLDSIVRNAAFPCYAELRNTGLERSHKLAKDLEWFKGQGRAVPEPSSPGAFYALYLEEVSKEDPQALVCHLYTVYFGHTAVGQIIGRKVTEKILDNKMLEFHKWDAHLPQLLRSSRDKLNMVASNWSREEKDHCLKESEKAFKYLGDIIRLIVSQ